MGKLKQLLPYRGRTFVEHVIGEATEAGFGPVIVVVGAEVEAMRGLLAARPVEIVQNDAWRLGMGSSITAGMRRLEEMRTDAAAVAILLADQPLVTVDHLVEMRRLVHTGTAAAVAAQYNGTLGVPAIFKRSVFAALHALTPESGARHLLRESGIEVAALPVPEAAVDIDTPEDFARLVANSRAIS